MEFVRLTLCLFALVPSILCGGPALRYEEDNESGLTTLAGTKSYSLVWESDIEGNPEYTLIEIKHHNPVTKEERMLGKVDGMTPSEVAEGYSVNVTKPEMYKKITLTIDVVEAKDDGIFIATAISNEDADTRVSIAKNVTVIKPISEVHLQFHEREAIMTKPEDAVEVEAGTYSTKCIAEGSNPAATDVTLHLDGQAVALEGTPMIEQMDGDVRQFRTTVMGNVNLEEKAGTIAIECVAKGEAGETLSTSLDLKVMVPEKKDVKCHETTAKEGDMSVKLVCDVDTTNMNVTEFAFQIGKTGEILKSGAVAEGNDTVSVSETSPGKTTLTLTLAKIQDWHFDSDFYLLITTQDGQVRKEPLTLDSSDGGNGNCLTASLGWILFLAFVVLLSRH